MKINMYYIIFYNDYDNLDANFASSDHTRQYITYYGVNTETASEGSAGSRSDGLALSNQGLFLTGTYNDSSTPATYGNILNIVGAGSGQLLCGWSGTDSTTDNLYYRSHRDTSSGGWGAWKRLAYTSSATVGGTAQPCYVTSGTITACSSTVGAAAKPVYMSSGTITACSSTVGSSTNPVYMNAGTITACTSFDSHGSISANSSTTLTLKSGLGYVLFVGQAYAGFGLYMLSSFGLKTVYTSAGYDSSSYLFTVSLSSTSLTIKAPSNTYVSYWLVQLST